MPKFECESETEEVYPNWRGTGRTVTTERTEESIEAPTARDAAAKFMDFHGMAPDMVTGEDGQEESFYGCHECCALVGDDDSTTIKDAGGTRQLVCRPCAAGHARRPEQVP